MCSPTRCMLAHMLTESAAMSVTSMNRAGSVSICASIHRVGEHMMDGGIRWSNPADRAVHALARRKGQSFGMEPEPDLAHRSQFRELREHRANSADHSFIGMETNFAVFFAPHKTYGQPAAQLAARGLVADSAIQPGAQDMKLRFRHSAF